MDKDAKWYAEWLRLATAPTEDEIRFINETADFIENLAAELEKVKRERDAAVEKYKRMKENALILSEAVEAYDRQNHKKYNSSGVQENGGLEDALQA